MDPCEIRMVGVADHAYVCNQTRSNEPEEHASQKYSCCSLHVPLLERLVDQHLSRHLNGELLAGWFERDWGLGIAAIPNKPTNCFPGRVALRAILFT